MAFIQIISEVGVKFVVNRYFLQLYDEMFYKLMIDHPNNDIILIFVEESQTSIETFLKNVNSKHINCSNFKNQSDENSDLMFYNKQTIMSESLNSKDNFTDDVEDNCGFIRDLLMNEKSKSCLPLSNNVDNVADDNNIIKSRVDDGECVNNDDQKTTESNSENFNVKSTSNEKSVIEKEESSLDVSEVEKDSLKEQFIQCPFGCSYSEKSQDKIYAHLIINHKVEMKKKLQNRNHKIFKKFKSFQKLCVSM